MSEQDELNEATRAPFKCVQVVDDLQCKVKAKAAAP
jgi:hypothetical protein